MDPTLDPVYDDDLWWALGILREKLHVCGCGDPGASYDLVRELLRALPWHQDAGETARNLCHGDGPLQIIAGAMTDADLIVHGGGVGGSWAEPDGERLLAILERVEPMAAELGFDDPWDVLDQAQPVEMKP